MENKYFTPLIEDIKVGYECEYFEPYSQKIWESYTFDRESIEEYILCSADYFKKNFRTLYLTKEQIELEGWIYDDSEKELSFVKGPWDLTFFPLINTIIIDNEDKDSFIFKGKCKDINTFRYICKLCFLDNN